jgi:hypothetical protein
MRLGSTFALPVLALMSATLFACSSAQHQDPSHPGYGDAQYRTDLADCRRQHSTVISIQGYDVQNKVKPTRPQSTPA